MARARLRLPHWTAHPGFGVAVLLVLAVALIVHGEPQPSSRPSGRSVVVGSQTPAVTPQPAMLLIRDGVVERRAGTVVRKVGLPAGVVPVSVVSSGRLAIVLGVVEQLQHAYAVTSSLQVLDLGLADAAIPGAGGTAMIVERAIEDPGRVLVDSAATSGATSVTASASASSGRSSATATSTSPRRQTPTDASSVTVSETPTSGGPSEVPERDFIAFRFDANARQLGGPEILPDGYQVATDSAVGLVVWKPLGVIVDRGTVIESLGATASLVRPDGSVRVLGPYHPLAATSSDLLVWDVLRSQFGLISLEHATATSTETTTVAATSKPATSHPASSSRSTTSARTSAAGTASGSASASVSESASASASPTTVVGVRFYAATRGIVVTGPASFSPDGSAFAVYAAVGNRRRLVIAKIDAVGTDQVEVVALAQPTAIASASSSPSASGVVSSTSGTSASSVTASATSSPTEPVYEPEGFPVTATSRPWWDQKQVVGVAPDGTVISYFPGSARASVLDVGTTDVLSLALAP